MAFPLQCLQWAVSTSTSFIRICHFDKFIDFTWCPLPSAFSWRMRTRWRTQTQISANTPLGDLECVPNACVEIVSWICSGMLQGSNRQEDRVWRRSDKLYAHATCAEQDRWGSGSVMVRDGTHNQGSTGFVSPTWGLALRLRPGVDISKGHRPSTICLPHTGLPESKPKLCTTLASIFPWPVTHGPPVGPHWSSDKAMWHIFTKRGVVVHGYSGGVGLHPCHRDA